MNRISPEPVTPPSDGDSMFACDPIQRPLMLIVSAPSGGGKSTLCRRLLRTCPKMQYSISCTTRAPRGNEQDGLAYHFLTRAMFEKRIERGDFLEHAEVYGQYYGTLRADIEAALDAGRDVLLDIDVQGTRSIRDSLMHLPAGHRLRGAFVDVFIMPPSLTILEQRLRTRAEDADEVIARRLLDARNELRAAREYSYRIVNDDLDASEEALRAIVIAEHHRNLDQAAVTTDGGGNATENPGLKGQP